MKRHFTYICLLISFLFTQQLKGQNIQVDSLIVTPQNPVKNDSVIIRLYTMVAFKSKKLLSGYHISSDTITLKTCYTISGATSVSFFADTFRIGKLKEGKYVVNFTGYISLDTNACNGLMDSTNYVDSFIVKPPENVLFNNASPFGIYPNPAYNELYISVTQGVNIERVQIRNIQGSILRQFNNSNNPLNLSALPAGIYLLYIETNKGRYINEILKQ